jgi:multicomponent Na+:H+ antiporter subunit F
MKSTSGDQGGKIGRCFADSWQFREPFTAIRTMQEFLLGLAVFLLMNLAAGLLRIVRGPAPADRMMAAQLFGTTGVAILLVLAQALETPGLRNVALVFSLLATLATVAFVRLAGGGTERRGR